MRNKAITNALWLILAKLAQMAIQLVLMGWTARYLGPGDFGRIHYAAAFTGFLAPLCGLGLPDTLVGELARKPEAEGQILGTALGMQLLAGTVSVGAVCFLAGVPAGVERPMLAVLAWSAAAMALQAFGVFRCWLQYRGMLKQAAGAALGAYCATAVFRVWLLTSGKGVGWFAFAGAVEAALAGALLLRAYRGRGGTALGVSRKLGRELFRRSRHFILPGILAAVYAQTDKLMLGTMLGEGPVGHYAAAVSLSGGWCFLLSAMVDAVYPEILEAHQKEEKQFLRRNRQLYGGVFYLSAAVSLALCLLADPLVGLLYGEHYRPAGTILRLLTWQTAFSYLGVARNAWVVCRDAQRHLVWAYAVAAVGNIGLNLLMIPRWGAVGAAAATLAAQILGTVGMPLLIPSLRESVILMGQAVLLRGIREEKTGWKRNWIWKS